VNARGAVRSRVKAIRWPPKKKKKIFYVEGTSP
jgi:hypothetical protein